MLAENLIDLKQSELMIDWCAGVLDTGSLGTAESSMAKVAVSEALMRIADRCVQVMGGTGVSTETIVEQAFREIRAFRIYDGPTEVHKWSLAKKIKRDWKAEQHERRRGRDSDRGFPGGSIFRRRSGGGLDPNSRGSASFRLLDLESVCLPHKVAQLAGAIGPRIEIGGQVGKPFSDLAETNPSVFAFHLGDDLFDHGDGCVSGLKQRRPRGAPDCSRYRQAGSRYRKIGGKPA